MIRPLCRVDEKLSSGKTMKNVSSLIVRMIHFAKARCFSVRLYVIKKEVVQPVRYAVQRSANGRPEQFVTHRARARVRVKALARSRESHCHSRMILVIRFGDSMRCMWDSVF